MIRSGWSEIPMAKEMTLLEHIEELRDRVLKILATVVGIVIFVFFFTVVPFDIGGRTVYLPFPDPFNNIASQVIKRIRTDQAPDYVRFIVTSPEQAVLGELYTSIFLGVVLGMPMIVYQIAAFVSPGLYTRERALMLKIIIPVTGLFLAGTFFSYAYVTRWAMSFLYQYTQPLEAEAFITIVDLLSFVLLLTLAFGISFQLPVVMYALSALGVVNEAFWRKNWRYALVAIVIFGAIITPDSSGITMWYVALPMMGLYGVGYLAIRMRKGKTPPPSST